MEIASQWPESIVPGETLAASGTNLDLELGGACGNKQTLDFIFLFLLCTLNFLYFQISFHWLGEGQLNELY